MFFFSDLKSWKTILYASSKIIQEYFHISSMFFFTFIYHQDITHQYVYYGKAKLTPNIYLFIYLQGVFKTYDKDNSGKLNSYELRSALNASGKYEKQASMRYLDIHKHIQCNFGTTVKTGLNRDPNKTESCINQTINKVSL